MTGLKALIAMSGGVDSSVAALLAQQAGFACVGCTMRLYENAESMDEPSCDRTCCSLNDTEDARSVSFRLGIPYYVFNFQDEFRRTVIDKFISRYEAGLTPNPCIDCNRFLKFGKLYERAAILGCGKIVTGHYARVEKRDGRFLLKKALDQTKDQSYVLYFMTQEQLSHAFFPLGGLRKAEVRQIARDHGFGTAEKPDSQDICFVPNGDYTDVIRRYTRRDYPAGRFLSTDGRLLGTHRGLIHYTPGQRRGLGISAADPLYVCRICPETNSIVLGTREELYSKTVLVGNVNWISCEAPAQEIRCRVKIRYRQKEQTAVVCPIGPDSVRIVFDAPQRAVAPGQAAVFYKDDTVLGGGEIRRDD